MQKVEALNILISSFGYVDGPGYQRTFKIAVGLAKVGHNVVFLTSQHGTYKFPYRITFRNGVKEVAVFDCAPKKLKKLGLSFMASIIKMVYVLRKKFDILYTDTGHRISSGLPCWIHKLFFNTKTVSEWWDYYGKGGQFEYKPVLWKYTYGLIDNQFEIWDKKNANGIIVLSEYTKTRAIDLGISESKISVINGGADIDSISFEPNSNKHRIIFGLQPEDFVILLSGVTAYKDFGNLLLALALFNALIPVKVVTTGKALTPLAHFPVTFNNKIIQFGWVKYEDYSKLLSTADIFFLYQTKEKAHQAKWPNKIGDYLAAGRPILLNPINEVSKLIRKENSGLITMADSAEELKEQLIFLYQNKNNLSRKGKLNRVLAEKNSWDLKAKQVETFFQKLSKKRIV